MVYERAYTGSDFQDSSGTAQPEAEGLRRRSDRNSALLSSTTNSTSGPYLMADRAASDRSLLIAIDALLRSGRVETAISVLESELGGGC